MYKFGIHEFLVKKDKVKLVADYIEEHIGVDFVIRENSVVIFDIREEHDKALRAYLSKHDAWQDE